MVRRHRDDNTKSKTTRDVNAAARVQLALQLRTQGMTWDEIAVSAGFSSRGAAHNAVMRELERTVSGNVEEMRREEAAILTQLHRRCMKAAMDESNRGFLFAVDRVISIRERFSRLYGLDAKPDTIPDGVTIIRQYDVEVDQV